jgi:hypothetical protein
MEFNIQNYLDSLPEDIVKIDINNKNITHLSDLTKFKNLKILNCEYNKLTYLPILPKTLKELNCSDNELIYLPILPETLEELNCSYNKLTDLPTLPKNINMLNCCHNKLKYLPCQLFNIEYLDISNNPKYKIIDNTDLKIVKKNINTINNFRHIYYCIKFRNQFRKWLWERVKEPKIIKKYNPNYLIKNLNDIANLDDVLNAW